MQLFSETALDQGLTSRMKGSNNAVRDSALAAYRREDFAHLSPAEVIYRLYDMAILGCKKNDRSLARKAINELIVGLNFKYEEIALGLYKLYDYSKRCIARGNMAEAAKVLEELRSAWGEAFSLHAGQSQ